MYSPSWEPLKGAFMGVLWTSQLPLADERSLCQNFYHSPSWEGPQTQKYSVHSPGLGPRSPGFFRKVVRMLVLLLSVMSILAFQVQLYRMATFFFLKAFNLFSLGNSPKFLTMHTLQYALYLLSLSYLLILEKEMDRQTSVCCSTYFCIHCLIFLCALTGDCTCNLAYPDDAVTS